MNDMELVVEEVEACSTCERIFDLEEMITCLICGRHFCTNHSCECGIDCEVCGINYCEVHVGVYKVWSDEDEDEII